MKCHGSEFIPIPQTPRNKIHEVHPTFPETLVDYLSGKVIPFSNRDNIRQKLVKTLIEGKGYLKKDIALDRVITFESEGRQISSPVDISVCLGDRTFMVFKCASGSVVSRERQIIATARLLEEYVIPFAVVTNGVDIELLDTISEQIIGEGMQAILTRQELLQNSKDIILRSPNKKKLIYEQRVLFTYDTMSCNISCRSGPET